MMAISWFQPLECPTECVGPNLVARSRWSQSCFGAMWRGAARRAYKVKFTSTWEGQFARLIPGA